MRAQGNQSQFKCYCEEHGKQKSIEKMRAIRQRVKTGGQKKGWSDEETKVLLEVVEDHRKVRSDGKNVIDWKNAAPAVDAKLKRRLGNHYRKWSQKQMASKVAENRKKAYKALEKKKKV